MPFKISEISSNPVWDTLAVAKITNYPFEKGAFKPFAQVRACVNEQGLHLRMWAFETVKRPNSLIIATFQFLKNSDRTLTVTLYGDGRVKIFIRDNGDDTLLESQPQVKFFEGEDLEGIYWGACVTISSELIKKYFDNLSLSAGYTFKGNFFKTCTDPDFDHAGCFSYVDVPKSTGIFDKRRYDEFTVVKY